MSAQSIFDLAPIGSIVAWSDGTPRPPERHKKKLDAWRADNMRGRLIAKPGERKVIDAGVKAEAITTLIADWNRDYDPTKSALILAHLRRDVRALNGMARAKLVERGLVGRGHLFRTTDGDAT